MEVVVGRVVKAHGLTGELVVEVRTDDPDARFAPGARLRATKPRGRGPHRDVVVDAARDHGARLLLRLAGVTNRDAADELRGYLLVIDTDELPPIEEPDEYYDHQLIGLQVQTGTGEHLGAITDVLHTGAGEVLVVRRVDSSGTGSDEVLVPFVAVIVTSVSLADGTVTIDPPDGLLDLG